MVVYNEENMILTTEPLALRRAWRFEDPAMNYDKMEHNEGGNIINKQRPTEVFWRLNEEPSVPVGLEAY
jgi:hypothetical protein